jgi:hypothetical protein
MPNLWCIAACWSIASSISPGRRNWPQRARACSACCTASSPMTAMSIWTRRSTNELSITDIRGHPDQEKNSHGAPAQSLTWPRCPPAARNSHFPRRSSRRLKLKCAESCGSWSRLRTCCPPCPLPCRAVNVGGKHRALRRRGHLHEQAQKS